MRFLRPHWGTNKMTQNIAGANNQTIRGKTLPYLMDLASSIDNIVAIVKHPEHQEAAFLTYLEGTTSSVWDSWPIYIRKELLNPSWKVGSYVEIGDSDTQASVRTGMCFSKGTIRSFID